MPDSLAVHHDPLQLGERTRPCRTDADPRRPLPRDDGCQICIADAMLSRAALFNRIVRTAHPALCQDATLSGHARLLEAAAQCGGQSAFGAMVQSSAYEPCWAEWQPLN